MTISANDLKFMARKWVIAAGTPAVATPVRVFGVYIAPGAGTSTVTLHDSAAADNTKIVLSTTSDRSSSLNFEPTGVKFDTALTIATTGTPASIVVTYLLDP